LSTLKLSNSQEKITKKVLKNARERLEFLNWVGLNYMNISRKAWTLSWWEAQRIRLATQLWTKLEWIIYILDEPSIGLHPRDNNMLIENLKALRNISVKRHASQYVVIYLVTLREYHHSSVKRIRQSISMTAQSR
jgi:excinuclease ABC subunit A